MNIVGLIGRFVRDPELRYTETGKAVCSFTLAVRNPFDPDNADFISCVAWEKRGELIAEMKTGALIGVAGRINTRNYENNEGKRVYITEVNVSDITFIQPKENAPEPEPAKSNARTTQQNQNRSGNGRSNSRQSPRR